MSSPSWKLALHQSLIRLRKRHEGALRIAVVGIGHELRGDDAAGVVVARRLQPLASGKESLLVLDAGPAPENFTGPLRRFGPHLVILVDAAQMDAAPGEVQWLDWQDTTGISAATHALPPYVLAGYLVAEIGCRVALVGIQPQDTAIGAPLSPEVDQAVQAVIHELSKICS